MSNLTNENGTHEKEALASEWLGRFYPYLSKMLYEKRIIGLEIGGDYYKFKDPERPDGKEITIKITVE